jgi:geranylgeranyl reductase family protein
VPDFDALIVGAGPAGAMAASTLAKRGARVALIDPSHPREKACGGGVTGRALELAGNLPGTTHGQSIDHIIFETTDRSAAVAVPDRDALKVFPRESLDAALLERAVAAGAVHIVERAAHVSRDGSGWAIGRARAPWLIGADGAGGVVRKQVFRAFDRRQLSIAAGSYVDGIETTEIVIRFVDRPSGYLWSFPRPGHLAAGACAQADETTTTAMHAVTDKWLDEYRPAAGLPRRRYAWPIPSLSAADVDRERPAGAGWMLVGDAAGLVDPITREGIFFALRSGQLAATAVMGSSASQRYTEAVRDELHPELRRAAHLKAGFFRPRFTGLLIDALKQSSAIREVMIDLVAGRQPYAGLKRRLLATFEVGLMLRLITSPGIRRAPER